jgi:hypothetical protein
MQGRVIKATHQRRWSNHFFGGPEQEARPSTAGAQSARGQDERGGETGTCEEVGDVPG